MVILLTVVTGYINDYSVLKSQTFVGCVPVKEGEEPCSVIADKVEELRKSWPVGLARFQNVISVSHSILP